MRPLENISWDTRRTIPPIPRNTSSLVFPTFHRIYRNFPAFDFHATWVGMLGPTLIRHQVVQVCQPHEKPLLASTWMVEPLGMPGYRSPYRGVEKPFHSVEVRSLKHCNAVWQECVCMPRGILGQEPVQPRGSPR